MNYLRGEENSKRENSISIDKTVFEKLTTEDTHKRESSPETGSDKDQDTATEQDKQEALARLKWVQLMKGDLDALGALYDLYADELFDYGMGKVSNRTRVMDGIHDLFVDLYKYRSNLSIPTNIKFYLLKSLSRKMYRKQTADQHISLEDFNGPKNFTASPSFEEELIEVERADENARRVRLALCLLTVHQRKALDLKFRQNLPYTEIASTMDISIATSRTLVYRALTVLRNHLGQLIILIGSIFF